ncbi:MAG: hypothetical protein KBS46_07485 [Clostridiales bacterium]|nr:hypothetical protein [Candidatus Apopatocola equi]MCQ2438870.1 hypothetical protein [Oscillospiraceae bacterium]
MDENNELNQQAERFREKYPDVDLLRLEQEGAFRKFCGSRLYREPTEQLYEDYMAFTREAEDRAERRWSDRSARSTGSGGGKAATGLSRREQQELEDWNRAFPGMRMSAKEFRER